jgi:hypothetical protein
MERLRSSPTITLCSNTGTIQANPGNQAALGRPRYSPESGEENRHMYLGQDGIQPVDAAELLRKGWARQEDVITEAVQTCIKFINEMTSSVRDERRLGEFEPLLKTLRRDPWPYESRYVIEPDSRFDHMLGVYIAPGTILKIGGTLRKSIVPALGVVLYSAATTNTGGLLYLGYLVFGWPLVQNLASAFEKVEDPDDFLVFEAVAAISAELRIVDTVALDRENFTLAYGKCAPFIEDIVRRLGSKVPEHTVKKSLASLSSRNILVCVDQRWSVSF